VGVAVSHSWCGSHNVRAVIGLICCFAEFAVFVFLAKN